MGIWGIGAGMIVYLAGLKGIPTELYDAARIDGAGWFAQMRHVTLPMISPVIFYTLILGVVEVLQYFLVPLVLKNGTGEPGGSTLLLQPVHLQELLHVPEHVVRGHAGLAAVRGHPADHAGPVPARRDAGSTTPARSADAMALPEATPLAPPAATRSRWRSAAARARPRAAGRRSLRGDGRRSFLLTLIAVVAVAAFLSPMLRAATVSIKSHGPAVPVGIAVAAVGPGHVPVSTARTFDCSRSRSTGPSRSSRCSSRGASRAPSSTRPTPMRRPSPGRGRGGPSSRVWSFSPRTSTTSPGLGPDRLPAAAVQHGRDRRHLR